MEEHPSSFTEIFTQHILRHSIFNDSEIKVEPDTVLSPSPNPSFMEPERRNDTTTRLLDAQHSASHPTPHIENHNHKKSKPQTCHTCGQVLSSASSYYVHLKKHSDNKPYRCPMCEASFCRKPYLEVHLRTHTGEKPFECDICKKRFTQKSSLNTHKRSHSGLRPYVCKVCFKSFSVKSYLAAHRWCHAASNGISCSVCHLTFTSRTQYTEHIRTHNTRGYECEYCPKYFAKEAYLIRHNRRIHYKQYENK